MGFPMNYWGFLEVSCKFSKTKPLGVKISGELIIQMRVAVLAWV